MVTGGMQSFNFLPQRRILRARTMQKKQSAASARVRAPSPAHRVFVAGVQESLNFGVFPPLLPLVIVGDRNFPYQRPSGEKSPESFSRFQKTAIVLPFPCRSHYRAGLAFSLASPPAGPKWTHESNTAACKSNKWWAL
jgi:hypothetical protein